MNSLNYAKTYFFLAKYHSCHIFAKLHIKTKVLFLLLPTAKLLVTLVRAEVKKEGVNTICNYLMKSIAGVVTI